MFALLNMRLN